MYFFFILIIMSANTSANLRFLDNIGGMSNDRTSEIENLIKWCVRVDGLTDLIRLAIKLDVVWIPNLTNTQFSCQSNCVVWWSEMQNNGVWQLIICLLRLFVPLIWQLICKGDNRTGIMPYYLQLSLFRCYFYSCIIFVFNLFIYQIYFSTLSNYIFSFYIIYKYFLH